MDVGFLAWEKSYAPTRLTSCCMRPHPVTEHKPSFQTPLKGPHAGPGGFSALAGQPDAFNRCVRSSPNFVGLFWSSGVLCGRGNPGGGASQRHWEGLPQRSKSSRGGFNSTILCCVISIQSFRHLYGRQIKHEGTLTTEEEVYSTEEELSYSL